MKIFLHEIGTEETELDFTEADTWVLEAVKRVDETSVEEVRKPKKTKRPVKAHLSLRRVDDVIVVSGSVDTTIELICSRCAAYFDFQCKPSFSGLFCTDPVMAGIAHQSGSGKPMGQNKGFARHAHDFAGSEDGEKDLDITYLSKDYIELGDVLTEQLRLQIPFQPLCQENCKGICPQCGTDLNKGRCACAKIKKNNAFSVLKDLKIPN